MYWSSAAVSSSGARSIASNPSCVTNTICVSALAICASIFDLSFAVSEPAFMIFLSGMTFRASLSHLPMVCFGTEMTIFFALPCSRSMSVSASAPNVLPPPTSCALRPRPSTYALVAQFIWLARSWMPLALNFATVGAESRFSLV